LILGKKRRLDVLALDFNTNLPTVNTWINAEWAWIFVDVPQTYSQQYAEKQNGGFIDIVQPIIRKTILGFERSVINGAIRTEYVDWNAGRFNETGSNIREDYVAVVPGVSWRPTSQTVIRLNYRYSWLTDILGNRPSKTAGFQFGFSSYF
jgi:hypothetical protein